MQCCIKLIQHHERIVLSFDKYIIVSNITDVYPLVAIGNNGDNGGEHAHKNDSTQKEVGAAFKCCRK